MPQRMHALGVSFEELEVALANFARNSTGGFIDQRAQEFMIRNIGQTTSLDDLRETVVAWNQGAPVTVAQVASRWKRPVMQGRGRLPGRLRGLSR